MPEVRAPRVTRLRLPELTAAGAADVKPEDVREAELLTSAGLPSLQWDRTTLRGCQIEVVAVAAWVLDRCRLLECRLADPEVTSVRGRDATWRAVEVRGGRLPALELDGSTWDGVMLSGTRLGYVNLRDATLTDVEFAGCRIDTLDLGAATAHRLRFADCVVEELIVTRAALRDGDLRGATIDQVQGVAGLAGASVSPDQVLALAPALAAELGIHVGA